MKLKALKDQVMVITGATSGIGLETAREAAKAGAKLVLAARNEDVLKQVVEDIKSEGGVALYVVADVGVREDVERIAMVAKKVYEGFDTWINNAGVDMWGKAEDITEEDARRLFDTNFWGMVNGSLVALPVLKKRGGALINVASVAADVPYPLQSFYVASKHALKGFTNSLRMEVMHDQDPVSISLIKPAAISTPLLLSARYYTEKQPWFPPPRYSPKEVTLAILKAATSPVRDIYVGGVAAGMAMFSRFAPRVADRIFARTMVRASQHDNPGQPRSGNMYESMAEGVVSEDDAGKPRPSVYTRLKVSPAARGLLALAAATLIGSVVVRRARG